MNATQYNRRSFFNNPAGVTAEVVSAVRVPTVITPRFCARAASMPESVRQRHVRNEPSFKVIIAAADRDIRRRKRWMHVLRLTNRM